ncbi:MAG: polymer-forming cytoskeletal protein [Pseudomonadota bacterium]
MLGSKKSGASISGKTTLLSTATVIKGDILFSGVLDVEGLVQGNIVAESGKDALVRVIDKGRVEGEIRSPSVVINGTVDGDVHSSVHLELASKARVTGNVYYARVEMAAGAEVNGGLAHTESPSPDSPATGSAAAKAAKVEDASAGLAVVSGKLD